MAAPVLRPWPVALTIAGSDSSGGAGIQADLRTFAAFETWGAVAITALTAQNLWGVAAVEVVSAGLVSAQVDAVVAEGKPAATKTGMLANAEVVEAVAGSILRHDLEPLVVDPVMVATSGSRLLDEDAVASLVERLLPLASVVTPNLAEAEVLLGRPVPTRDEMVGAAQDIADLGPRAVLLKGGHLRGAEAPDLLLSGGEVTWLEGERVPAAVTHGTGCTLSAALAAGLARGWPLDQAAKQAKAFVARALMAWA